MLRPTARIITSETTTLATKTVTNALTQAKKDGLFTRNQPGVRSRFQLRTDSRGWLTAKGWSALGSPPDEWVAKFGDSWDVLDRVREADEAHVAQAAHAAHAARDALAILENELRAEEALARARRGSVKSASASRPRRASPVRSGC